MSLYQRAGSPFWQYDFAVNGQRFRGSTGETRKRDALKVEDYHKEAAKKQGQRKKEWTIESLCTAYWDDHAQHRPSQATILGQLAALRRLLGKDRKVSAITNAAVLDYRAKRRGETKIEQHSINREITILRAAMNHAAEVYGVAIPKLAWEKLKTEEPPPRQRYLTFEEWGVLLSVAHPSIKPILICAVTTGLRKTNILEMNWSQVRLTAKRIAVTVKGNKIHEVRIAPILAAALTTSERKGKVFDGKNFEKRWRIALRDAGLEDFRFHDLRHTFASWARQNGADIADVKDALGHSDIAMTMRYAHIKPDAEDTAFDRVSAAIASHSAPQPLQKRQN
jgi:integrase